MKLSDCRPGHSDGQSACTIKSQSTMKFFHKATVPYVDIYLLLSIWNLCLSSIVFHSGMYDCQCTAFYLKYSSIVMGLPEKDDGTRISGISPTNWAPSWSRNASNWRLSATRRDRFSGTSRSGVPSGLLALHQLCSSLPDGAGLLVSVSVRSASLSLPGAMMTTSGCAKLREQDSH